MNKRVRRVSILDHFPEHVKATVIMGAMLVGVLGVVIEGVLMAIKTYRHHLKSSTQYRGTRLNPIHTAAALVKALVIAHIPQNPAYTLEQVTSPAQVLALITPAVAPIPPAVALIIPAPAVGLITLVMGAFQ